MEDIYGNLYEEETDNNGNISYRKMAKAPPEIKDISDILGQRIGITKGAGTKIVFSTDIQTLEKIEEWFQQRAIFTAGNGRFEISQIEYQVYPEADSANVELRIWGV